LEDLYPIADFVTYPSLYEGFGNVLLETVYFRKPALVNRYSVFIDDIEPADFDFVTMDGEVTSKTVSKVEALFSDLETTMKVAEHNYNVAKQHFGFNRITDSLETVLAAT